MISYPLHRACWSIHLDLKTQIVHAKNIKYDLLLSFQLPHWALAKLYTFLLSSTSAGTFLLAKFITRTTGWKLKVEKPLMRRTPNVTTVQTNRVTLQCLLSFNLFCFSIPSHWEYRKILADLSFMEELTLSAQISIKRAGYTVLRV